MARSFYHVLEDELNVICATRASAGESAAMVLAGGLILLGQNCVHNFFVLGLVGFTTRRNACYCDPWKSVRPA